MDDQRARPDRSGPALLVGVSSGALVVLLAAGVVAAQWSGAHGPAWVVDLAMGRGAWGVVVPALTVALLATSWIALRRAGERWRPSGPVALAAVAAISLLLSLSAYGACPGDRLPFWGALSRALAAFGGDLDAGAFDGRGLCPQGPPLSVQLGFLLAQMLVVAAGAGVLIAVFPRQIARMRARRGRAVVVIGASEETLPLLAAISRATPGRTRMVVADTTVSPALFAILQSVDCLPVDLPVDDPERLASLLVDRRGRWRVDGLHLLSADPSDNLRRLGLVRSILTSHVDPSLPLPPRLQVRLDDPYQAEDWRRRHLSVASGRWLFDAQSIVESTADLAVSWIRQSGVAHVVITGASPFALALVERLDLARRQRAAERLGVAPDGDPAGHDGPHVVLAGASAQILARKVSAQRSRFGETDRLSQVEVVVGDDLGVSVPHLLDDNAGILVLADEDPIDRGDAEMAARHPQWRILAWDPESRGLSDGPVMGRMRSIGPTFDRPRTAPLDIWERLAMVNHARYLTTSGRFTPGDPARGAWEDLSAFTRGSNIRQAFTTLTSVGREGFSWSAWTSGDPAFLPPTQALDEPRLLAMAEEEHEQWCAYHRSHGWRWGPDTDKQRRLHADLVGWSELSPENQQLDVDGVLSTLASMEALGYRLRPVVKPGPRRFQRRAIVRARRLRGPRTWTGPHGAVLTGQRGDWLVEDAHRQWTVVDSAFRASYRPLGGGLWRATGTVLARRAERPTTIQTLEGDAQAAPGDWILTGTQGESWPVSPGIFWSHYEPAPDQSP